MAEPRPEPRRLVREERPAPLDMLVQVPGLLGAALLTRDGLPVVSQIDRLRRGESFMAMAAAALAAAEVMAAEMGLRDEGILLRLDHPQMTIALMAVSPELVIVAFALPGAPVERAFEGLRGG